MPMSPQRQRRKTLETLLTMLLEQTAQTPVVFLVEDLHWGDPSTLELLDLLMDQVPTVRMFVLVTCRPTFQPTWGNRSYLTQITVNRLSRPQVEQMVGRLTRGKSLPAEVLRQIVAKTDGVPLFVEELTKAILESGHVQETEHQYELAAPLSTVAIPDTLHDSLMARLDRLDTAKAVAHYAAVIGRQCSFALLQAVSQLDEATLQRDLQRLIEAELVFQRGLLPQATYTFKHALIQEAAYQSLLRSTRKHYHERITQVLVAQFPEMVETQPEVLAHHYAEAGLYEQAIPYWQQAGQRAFERSANLESISHLTKGLELITVLPDSPERARYELGLQIIFGAAMQVTRGYAALEVEQIHQRTYKLCQQVGEALQLFWTLEGLWAFYFLRANLQTALDLGEQLLSLAQRADDPFLSLQVDHRLGATLNYLGDLAAARARVDHGIALYESQPHRLHDHLHVSEPGVSCLYHRAMNLWLLGYPDQALRRNHEALALAKELSRPYSLAIALFYTAVTHQFRLEGQAAQECAEAAIMLSNEQGFRLFAPLGTLVRGWALTIQGQREEGIAQLHQGLTSFRAIGAELGRPWYLAMLAEAYGKEGQIENGLSVLAEALELVDTTGERWWEAELHRLTGELLLAHSSGHKEQEAEGYFVHALDITRRRQSRSLELRTATSLSRLWQRQGKRTEARELLAPIYGWFVEGFDTVDLREAKALLDDLT